MRYCISPHITDIDLDQRISLRPLWTQQNALESYQTGALTNKTLANRID